MNFAVVAILLVLGTMISIQFFLMNQATKQAEEDVSMYDLTSLKSKEAHDAMHALLKYEGTMTKRQIASARPVVVLGRAAIGLFFRHAIRHGLVVAPSWNRPFTVEQATQLSSKILSKRGNQHRNHAFDYVLDANLLGAHGLYESALAESLLFSRRKPMETRDYRFSLLATMTRPSFYAMHNFKEGAKAQSVSFKEWIDETQSDAGTVANPQAKSLGFKSKDMIRNVFSKPTHQNIFLKEGDKMILLEDRIEESLVILRRLLVRNGWSWNLFDLVRHPGSHAFWQQEELDETTDPEIEETLAEIHPLDFYLWELANERLNEAIQQEIALDKDNGARFHFEVAALREAQRAVDKHCRHDRPISKVDPNLYNNDPDHWRRGLGREFMVSICHWFMLEDGAVDNFEQQTQGHLEDLYSQILEEQLHLLAKTVTSKLKD
eukprot:m.3613 g.3613  ORF g.3613 m.3613 type:complete len:435 (-) comp2795_c0_seq1:133-1437(-)